MKKLRKQLEVNYSDLECGDKLGESGLGATYKGIWKTKDVAVAIKFVAGRLAATNKLDSDEIVHLGSLKHDNVTPFYGTSQDQHFCFITEFADNGSIHDYIHVKGHKPEVGQSVLWAQQIAEGMRYLHSERVVHRDLKPSNVLLTEGLNAKICDFGFAKFLEYAAIKELAGSYRWMAPEVMQQKPSKFPSDALYSDVFSYGMVQWELLNHKQPFSEIPAQDVRGEVIQRKRPPIPKHSKHYLYKLMQLCWKADHKARPSFEMILAALKEPEDIVLKIENKELAVGRILGEGGFGVVKKGTWKSRGAEVAIKTFLTKAKFKSEVEVISVLDHPNIIQFYGAVLAPTFSMVTEFAKEGSLFDCLYKKKKRLNMDQSLLWAEQIAEGMSYLHEHQLVHRDLKSSNVLLTSEKAASEMTGTTGMDGVVAKICDFGCARFLDNVAATTLTGTYKWMAPEILRKEPASFPCDVFSFGMVLWELLEHKVPFDKDTEVDSASKIKVGERPAIPEWREPYLAALLKMCWEDAPEARPTFAVILSAVQNREPPTTAA